MALRPYWSGQIRLSLVSLPVNVYAALNRSRQISFHMIYRPTGERVHHQNVVNGEPIENEDIVKGYEVEKGEYVLIEPEEIKKLKIPSKEVLEIVHFVPADAIDAVYYETPYFVAPDGKSAEDAFVVIREALRQSGKVGIGQLAIGGRERLCAIKPCGSGILLEPLRYEEEIRESDPYFGDIPNLKVDKEQLSLALELIKRKTTDFKPDEFQDHYRQALQELIESRIENRPARQIEGPRPVGKVVNLMDALRQSLKEDNAAENDNAPQRKAKAAGTKKKPAAKAKPAAKRRKAG